MFIKKLCHYIMILWSNAAGNKCLVGANTVFPEIYMKWKKKVRKRTILLDLVIEWFCFPKEKKARKWERNFLSYLCAEFSSLGMFRTKENNSLSVSFFSFLCSKSIAYKCGIG